MVKFKDYLKEQKADQLNEVSWDFGIHTFISLVAIPLTPKQMDEIFGKQKITAYHISDEKHSKRLGKIGKTKKSVSAFTKMNYDVWDRAIRGIRTEGGFISELEGYRVFKSPEDIMSMPDDKGRRWIGLGMRVLTYSNNPYIAKLTKSLYNEMAPKLVRILKSKNKNQAYYQSIVSELENYSTSKFVDEFASTAIDLFSDKLTTKATRREIYKEYIDETNKLLKRHKKVIAKVFMESDLDTENWNEILVNNFEVKNTYIFTDLHKDDFYIDTYRKSLKNIVDEWESDGIKLISVDSKDFYVDKNIGNF